MKLLFKVSVPVVNRIQYVGLCGKATTTGESHLKAILMEKLNADHVQVDDVSGIFYTLPSTLTSTQKPSSANDWTCET